MVYPDPTQPINFIFFDFGGTLGYEGQRDIFINANTLNKRLSVLYPDTLSTLNYLKNKGIKMGIISNTKWSRHDMYNALQKNGMLKYFSCLFYSSDLNSCSKPCDNIFLNALNCTNLNPKNVLYVGNNYFKDIIKPNKLGMQTAFITHNNNDLFTSSIINKGQQTYTLTKLSDLKKVI